MDLSNKNAIIYGAGGSMGSAIALALAEAGARVFLTGRNLSSLEKTANKIIQSGGKAHVAVVDALNEVAISDHIAMVVMEAGTVDISFNLIGYDVVQDVPLTTMKVSDFINPITMAMQTHFLTMTAAARIMQQHGSGVILALTATPSGIGYPYTGGFGPACCALESFTKQLASELGVYGIRVVTIRSAGSPDSRIFKEVIESDPFLMKPILKKMEDDTMLKQLPLMDDIAGVAVFLSSAMAGKITGVTVDVTAGTTAGLNYRVTLPPGKDENKVS